MKKWKEDSAVLLPTGGIFYTEASLALFSHVNTPPLVYSGGRAVFVLRTKLICNKLMLKVSILSSFSVMHTVGTLAYLSQANEEADTVI